MLKYEDDVKGAFAKLSDEATRKLIMEIVSNFHYRDMKHNDDGSMGTIRIGVHQLNDCLAFMFARGG